MKPFFEEGENEDIILSDWYDDVRIEMEDYYDDLTEGLPLDSDLEF